MQSLERTTHFQSGAPAPANGAVAGRLAHGPASDPRPILLTSAQAAKEVFGVSERTFHNMRAQAWFTARPRVLSSRFLRWVRADLEAAALNMPTGAIPEPSHFRAARQAPSPAAAAQAKK